MDERRRVLVTGGGGFVGSNVTASLAAAGATVAVLDDFSQCRDDVVDRLIEVASWSPIVYRVDVRDHDVVDEVCADFSPTEVVHCAGLKSVTESTKQPEPYFDTNVNGSISVLKAAVKHSVSSVLFSSSCTVYGNPPVLPITEATPLEPVSPYGWTKRVVEEMLGMACAAEHLPSAGALRYFNPVGADASRQLGDNPRTPSTNLVPTLVEVARGERDALVIYGNDYPTPDGTAIRDYVHITDVAAAHSAALDYLRSSTGYRAWNIGIGVGVSVLELVSAFERASGRAIQLTWAERRPGDAAEVWCDPTVAKQELAWTPRRSLEQMCADAWIAKS